MLTPYLAFSWLPPVGTAPRVVPMVRLIASSDIVAATTASDIAIALKAMPEGSRVLSFNQTDTSVDRIFYGFPKDPSAFCDDGIHYTPAAVNPSVLLAHYPALLAGIKAAGATINMIACDNELGYSTYGLVWPDAFQAIQDDHRASLVAAGVGFSDFVAAEDTSSGYVPRHTDKMSWDDYGSRQVNAAIATGLLAPAKAQFPDILVNNYGSSYVAKGNEQPDPNGYMSYWTTVFGNSQAPNCYAVLSQLLSTPALFPSADWSDPVSNIVWTLNGVRAASQNAAPIVPYLGQRDLATTIANDPKWDELVRHLIVNSNGNLLYFNSTPIDDSFLSNLLQEASIITRDAVPATLLTKEQIPYSTTGYNTIVSAARLTTGDIFGRVSFFGADTKLKVTFDGQTVTINKTTGSLGSWFMLRAADTPVVKSVSTLFSTLPPMKGDGYQVDFIDRRNNLFTWYDLLITTSNSHHISNATLSIAGITQAGVVTPLQAGILKLGVTIGAARFNLSLEIKAK